MSCLPFASRGPAWPTIEKLIVRLKREYPTWGAPRIRKRRQRAQGTPLTWPDQPNALWCADFKGEFMLADRRYCYPLTITDFATRYLLSCEALSSTREAYTFAVFERAFKDFGLPLVIRTDNGVPFAAPHAL